MPTIWGEKSISLRNFHKGGSTVPDGFTVAHQQHKVLYLPSWGLFGKDTNRKLLPFTSNGDGHTFDTHIVNLNRICHDTKEVYKKAIFTYNRLYNS